MDKKINESENKNKKIKNTLKVILTFKRAPTTSYNHQIFRKNTSKIDLEKAQYEAELLLNKNSNSEKTMNQSIFIL